MNEKAIHSGIMSKDDGVINYVITKYSRLLWPIASAVLKNVGNDQDVEECIADVFIDLWEHPEKFDPQRGSLKSWLCMVTRSRAIDRYRELSRRNTVSLDGAMMAGRMGVQEALLQEETRKELIAAVNALADLERDILIRRYYYEQKPREIAKDPHYYDLVNAAEVTAFIQSLEEGVYVINIEAWIDSDIMGYQDLSEQVFATGNATWPGLQ